ncbi:MAG: L,D-transpeptidase family protein [Solirubrobacteraceae bacterium MAG38_C4-C5]|nr:L,D-transpeptidase family protein [Candidatus Siliceabacter maunaloa]
MLAPFALVAGPGVALAAGEEQEAPATRQEAAAPGEAPSSAPGETAPTAPGETAAPAPEMAIELARVNGRHESALSGTRVRVEGTVSQYAPGQEVVVRTYRRGKKVAARSVTIKPGEDGGGRFVLGQEVKGSGHFVIRASHRGTDLLPTVVAPGKGFDVLPTRLRRGARGPGVRVVQKHLRELGYVTGRRGVHDARTARAVLAFRKMTRMSRSTTANRPMLDRLAAGHGRFSVRHKNHGRHVEADLSRQVIALIGADGDVERIYHTSSGKASTPTITGNFRVYRKQPGTNSLNMVHSVYFIRGYAVHGYKSVPTRPASAGCFRVPIPDAKSISDWMRMGTRVDVYRR